MFTLDQIHQAHSKVKSGADFPAYIRELKSIGVHSYTTYVSDGHTDYSGTEDHRLSTDAKYEAMPISSSSHRDQFVLDLRAHQQGKTDYPGFCRDCARSGIEKWVVDLREMTCVYYDQAGDEILTEQIPR
jgi:uncharacterized protein YbcV (DUF1398 family)